MRNASLVVKEINYEDTKLTVKNMKAKIGSQITLKTKNNTLSSSSQALNTFISQLFS